MKFACLPFDLRVSWPLLTRWVIRTTCSAWLLASGAVHALETPVLESGDLYVTTTAGDPASAGSTPYNIAHRPEFGDIFSGVARLVINGSIQCSGALIGDRQVLTAAHCVTNGAGASIFSSGTAQFALTPGSNAYTGTLTSVSISSVLISPGWNGQSMSGGNDLAILTLSSAAPVGAERYGIYTGSTDIGQLATKVGWGNVGSGSTGSTTTAEWRVGQNLWDTTYDQLDALKPASVLVYDFDNGTAARNTLSFFGFSDLGAGSNEVMSAPGDSGGPSFIDGLVAGIASFRFTYGPGLGDIDNFLNSSFGEIGGDTRVAAHSDWILASIPESPNGINVAWGLLVVLSAAHRVRFRRST